MKINTAFLARYRLVTNLLLVVVCTAAFYFVADVQPAMGESNVAPTTMEMVLRDTPLRSALTLIAENYGYQFESSADLNERVNLNLSGAGFEESVHQLLTNKPYNWALENKTLRVYKSASIKNDVQSKSVINEVVIPRTQQAVVEPEEKKILILQNRRPDEMVALLVPLVTDVKMMPDIRTNSILISGSKSAIKTLVKMAKDLDSINTVKGMEENKEYLSEVFALDYISDFEDLEQNLNFILYGSTQPMNNETSTTQQNATNLGGQILEQPTVPVRKEYYLLDKTRRLLMITASRDKMEIIREYFVRINTPLPQVLIEAHIVAIDEGFARSNGINWNFAGSYQGPVRPTDRPLGAPDSSAGAGTQIDPTEGFQFGQYNLSNLIATLQLAQDKNKGKILSQPKLMTLSGNEAKIHIGTRYPYKSSTTLNQSGGTAENIQYVDVGILLNVTPQVNTKSGTIVMKLSPEVSDVVGFRNDAPIITSRQTETVVEVADGKTVVIGGLLRDEDMRSKSGVPILREIPVLGEFFRYSSKSKSKTNLVIMITPRVVNVRGQTLQEEAVEAKQLEEEKKEAGEPSRLDSLVEKLRQKVNKD